MDSTAMDIDEDCPLCCDPYDDAQYERSRVTCSAGNGCGRFSICRLCVFRLDMQLRGRPVVIDDDTGDVVRLDPTACPQCKRTGAFREDKMAPLPEAVRTAAEEEARRRREEEAGRQRERALRHLARAPAAVLEIIREAADRRDEVVERTHHERIRIISGDSRENEFKVDRRGNSEVCTFGGITTIGVPDPLETSGVVYYEIIVGELPMFLQPKIQFGFSLIDGLEVTEGQSDVGAGDNARSWGFNALTGEKIHIETFGDPRSRFKWGCGKVIGVAANLDKGMVALSVDGDWQYINGNGVKFEDESIKAGVYPCISGKHCELKCQFGTDVEFAPPPAALWDAWPKYDDLTWFGLTEEARVAAMALGYTRYSWMDEDNPIERKSWNELSSEEQSAANTLGYDANIWAQVTMLWADKDDGDSSDEDMDEDYSPVIPFTSMPWHDMPDDARRAAETLGYTPAIWNDDGDGPLDDKSWNELTPVQQQAAIVLGDNEESWNKDSDDDSSDSDSSDSESTNDLDLPFDHMTWRELPRNVREAAEKLGHTAVSWDEDLKGSWDDKRWAELPLEQQFAAAVLGYDEAKWNSSIDFAHNLASIVFLGRPLPR